MFQGLQRAKEVSAKLKEPSSLLKMGIETLLLAAIHSVVP
jgi:hypothetical protein